MANILVTGTTGFVGANMARFLTDFGEDTVIGVRHDNSPIDSARLLGIDEKLTWTYGDLLDYSFVRRVVHDYEVDEIYHFAALPIVRIAGRSPIPVFEANITGTWNVLEAARNRGIEEIRVVHCSTDKAYGDTPQRQPYKETQSVGVSEIYGTSKAAADLIAQSYALNYGMKVVVVRPCNMFGPADLNPRIIPNTIRLCLQGKSPVIFKGIDYVREYIYVEDTVAAIHKVMKGLRNDAKGEIFNIGTGGAFDQSDIIKKILRHFPECKATVRDPSEYMKREIRYQKLDSSKIRKWFGWKPLHSIDSGIKATINWWREKPDLCRRPVTFTR